MRLDQALGQAFELIDPVRREPPVAQERLFQGPTTQAEAIERTARELLAEACGQLARREAGAQRVTVELIRSDLPPVTIEARVSRPARDPRRLWSLLAPKLERAHLGFGVEGVRVRARDVGRVRHEQSSRWSDDQQAEREAMRREAAELVDALAARLGAERVRRAGLAESHRPERAARWASALETKLSTAPPASSDRPTLLFDRPAPAEVLALTPDGPVHRVRYGGCDHKINWCVGPERLAPEWWRRADSTRDYFMVATSEGRWLWVARSLETGRWFVHGIWA
jgi:protein ImuB